MDLLAPEIEVFCNNCGRSLNITTQGPCAGCGHEVRLVTLTVTDFVDAIDIVEGTLDEEDFNKSKTFVAGEESYHDTNEVRTVLRVFDHRHRHEPESYYELVKMTHSEEVIKLVKEALADHQGHGSAKNKIPEFPDEWRRVAAYYVWEQEGRPKGRHINHWNQAKARLRKRWKAGLLPPIE